VVAPAEERVVTNVPPAKWEFRVVWTDKGGRSSEVVAAIDTTVPTPVTEPPSPGTLTLTPVP
jgi:hypothetical protein